ncbi:hypothetical protein K9M79_03075 [Candidatus Woesearchaeota archaeon]|nr:hypothetical protein [Candidatus Woesearchaeota archaeon]
MTPLQEMLRWARNNDILTIAERGVTTTTATGTFAGETSLLIAVTNIKNIRSIVVDSVTLTLGTDYDYDVNFSDTTIKTKITFTSAQTGAYVVTYDYGTDKIFDDYPRSDLKINSYPRMSVEMISETTDAYGIGGTTFIESGLYTFVIYGEDQKMIKERMESLRLKLKQQAKNFYNFPFVKPVNRGPVIKSDGRGQTILHANQDVIGMFKVDQV